MINGLVYGLLFLSQLLFGAQISQEDKTEQLNGRLIDNLRRFHSGQPALPPPVPVQADFKGLPTELCTEIFKFLSYAELIEFGFTDKNAEKLIKLHIKRQLASFNPHYLFLEDWINQVLFKILHQNFLIYLKLSHSEVVDKVELMIFKHLCVESQSLIRLILLAFVHETVHGIDAHIPLDMKHWRLNFIRKSERYKMPLTLAQFIEYHEENPGILEDDLDTWMSVYQFLMRNPSIIEQADFRTNLNRSSSAFHYMSAINNFPADFEIIFAENAGKDTMPFNEIQTEAAFNAINWTPETIARVHEELMRVSGGKKPRLARLFYRKFPELFTKFDPTFYIYTRDTLNPLQDGDRLIEAGFTAQDLLRVADEADLTPNLVHADMINKLDRLKEVTECYYA